MNKNIFIIDNEANVLYSLKSMLCEAGFNVVVENSFYETKKVVQDIVDTKTRFLIFDIDSIDKDSWISFVHDVKSDENLSDISVVVYTANQETGIKKRVMDSGVDYFFSKNDFVVGEFFEKILKTYNNIIKK